MRRGVWPLHRGVDVMRRGVWIATIDDDGVVIETGVIIEVLESVSLSPERTCTHNAIQLQASTPG